MRNFYKNLKELIKGYGVSVKGAQHAVEGTVRGRAKSRIGGTLPALCMVLMLMMGSGEVLGNTASNSGTGALSNGNIVVGGNHATFTFTPASGSFSDKTIIGTAAGYYYIKVGKNSSKDVSLTWSCNGGQTIKVTAVSFKVKLASGGKVTFNGSEQSYSLTSATKTCSASNNSGLTSGMVLKLTNTKTGRWDGDIEFQIDDISFTYTITPNAPSVSPTTKTLNVTINTNNKQTVGYKCFSASDHFGDYIQYAFNSNPGNAGHMEGDNFYATDSGTYQIKAKINALNNCHTESAWSSNLTITVNPLTPSFNAANGNVDISYTGSVVTKDLRMLISGYTGNSTSLSFSKVSASNGGDLSKATIATDGYTFSSTQLGTYTLKATYSGTKQYRKVERTFTITVGKRTPTVVFATPEHIYSGDALSNMAKLQYNGNDIALSLVDFTYSLDNPSWFSIDGANSKLIHVSTNYNEATTATLYVTTEETTYYKSVTSNKTYNLETKATPEFRLNGVLLDKNVTTNLYLEVDSSAHFTFNLTTSGLQYPASPSHFTYNHSTGILTATVAGDEQFNFNDPGNTTTFQHQCFLHLYVSKHQTELNSALGTDTLWLVDDSIAENTLYTVTKGDVNHVTVTSSNTNVIDKVNGKWVAKNAGRSFLTMIQPASDKWTADTVVVPVTVKKHTPEFTWHLPATVNWNRAFAHPVSSTNTDDGCTFSYNSNNTSAINYVNGSLRTFEINANNVGITVTQAGNRKWAEKSQTFYVNVQKMANHVEFTVNSQNVYNAVNGGTQGDVAYTSSGIRLGGSSTKITGGPAYNWEDKYIDIAFEGVPKKISFTTGLTSGAATSSVVWPGSGNNNGFWYVIEYSATGAAHTIWTENNNNNPGNKEFDLLPSTNKVRICYTGNFAGYVNNLKITERTEIVGVNSVDFGTTDAGSNATNKNITIDWYNVNPLTLSITGENASQFIVSPTSIASAKDSYAEKVPVTLSYKHNRGGNDAATLVISDGVITKEIALSGVTEKMTPSITWNENLSPLSRGENVTNPATSPVTLTYTSTDSTVVDIEGNTLKPLKKGNATITASFNGTNDPVWNSNSSSIAVEVTDMHAQHIIWNQTFTRLKWTDKPELSDKNTADFDLIATVNYYDVDLGQEVLLDHTITFTSDDPSVVQVLPGNILHVVGVGTTTLRAHVDGITNEFVEANVVRPVLVREPSLDCDTWVLDNASGSIAVIDDVSFDLDGEADSLYFDAWREVIKIVFEFTGGDLYVAEVYEDGSEKNLWNNETPLNTPQSYKCALSRDARKVRFYTTVGATGYHNFANVYARSARYVELDDTQDKTTKAIAFTADEVKPGKEVSTSFVVNYSNITDQLVVEHTATDRFSITPNVIGNECGDHGRATVNVTFLSNDVDTYYDTITIHNANQSVKIYVSAEVDRHQQQITWNPSTLALNTTDNVTFDATTTGSSAGLSVNYAVTAGSDVATINANSGALTIIKAGSVTIEATAAGNEKFYDATPVSKTFTISKVDPSITEAPTASSITLPNTLGASNLSGGEASVAGSFAWTNSNEALAEGTIGHSVTFTPSNTNWYNPIYFDVNVAVQRASQTITWNFDVTEMYGNAEYTFDAYASTGLTVTYSSSDETIASVNGSKQLVLHKGGEVTITAKQAGNETYLPVSESRTFTVLRWTPTVVENPVGGTLYVGRLLSDATLTGGLAKIGEQIIVGSFVWENANTATINIAGPATHNVIFIPQNGNFYNNVVCENIALTVLKYHPAITTNTLVASSIEFPDTLGNSHLSGSVTAMDNLTVPASVVAGSYRWKDSSDVLRPGLRLGTVLFIPNDSERYESVELSVPVQVGGGYIFTGDGEWTSNPNWVDGAKPIDGDDVIINGNVIISTEVEVNSLTIAGEGSVTMVQNGKLTVNGASASQPAYGDLVVKDSGEVVLNDVLKVNNFIIEAAQYTSGQVENPEHLDINGDAYIDITISDNATIDEKQWFGFTVPFPVNSVSGVQRINYSTGEVENISYNADYITGAYDSNRRAKGSNGWRQYSGILNPGTFYLLGVTTQAHVYRFHKTATGSLQSAAEMSLHTYNAADPANANWNAVGNPTLQYADASCPVNYVQIYNNNTGAYEVVDINDATFVVARPFFIQTGEGTLTLNAASGTKSAYYAPARRTAAAAVPFNVHFGTQTNSRIDQVFVSASDDADGTYTIGRDLAKAGTTTNVAQMMINACNHSLCVREEAWSGNTADFMLTLYTPKADVYTLSLNTVRMPNDGSELYLTENGSIIWNLSMSDYELPLGKGNHTQYGLRIVKGHGISTDAEDAVNDKGNGAEKIIMNDNLYILKDGVLFDATGKKVK